MTVSENIMTKKAVVIGGGPAGLAAALSLCENGISPEDIIILERDTELGGILNQCIHAGFGLHHFKKELTGPEYAEIYINKVKECNIPFITEAMVLEVTKEKTVTFVSPATGLCTVKADAVILAMGCRERPRGALGISGTRPSGVYTAGTAQKYVNIKGYLPGKRVVILGSGDIGLIMARRMTLEGAEVLAVCELMPYSGGLERNIAQCLNDYDIPLYLSHTVTKIEGKEHITGIEISKVDENRVPIKGTEIHYDCDTLLLSCGLIPENELTSKAGIALDRATSGAVVDQWRMTDTDGIFACGNVLHVHDVVDYVSDEAEIAGKGAADYIKAGAQIKNTVTAGIVPQDGVRYTVPQIIRASDNKDDIKVYFRVKDKMKHSVIKLTVDGEIMFSQTKLAVLPSEMQYITVNRHMLERILASGKAELSCKEVKK